MADRRITVDAAFFMAHIDRLKTAFPELTEDAELLASTIEGETDFERVLDRVIEAFLDAMAMKAATAERVDDLSARGARFGQKAEAMRSLAFGMMKAADQTSIRLPVATLSVRTGVASVVVDDIAELPQGFTKTETIAKKAEIKAALAAGETIPGAHLETGAASLSIRTK